MSPVVNASFSTVTNIVTAKCDGQIHVRMIVYMYNSTLLVEIFYVIAIVKYAIIVNPGKDKKVAAM